ncbi:hypothetical protein [uncultured Polaribacter sp.]|uniref:hypothetical protein n=1 Tax=uncultured Polaribacter sp. TaxID=174711 RepID=UPI0030DC65F4|tara:strand:- start:9115 stop:9306 length:192 start_codon:yes stop_codon:yes gene_type:complete
MGFFWDLIQQTAIQEQSEKSEKLEDRVTNLEKELLETKSILRKTLVALEKHLGKDIDNNKKIG